MDTLFGGSNHVEKGGNILAVEDPHHANINEQVNTNDLISKQGVATVREVRNSSAEGRTEIRSEGRSELNEEGQRTELSGEKA